MQIFNVHLSNLTHHRYIKKQEHSWRIKYQQMLLNRVKALLWCKNTGWPTLNKRVEHHLLPSEPADVLTPSHNEVKSVTESADEGLWMNCPRALRHFALLNQEETDWEALLISEVLLIQWMSLMKLGGQQIINSEALSGCRPLRWQHTAVSSCWLS